MIQHLANQVVNVRHTDFCVGIKRWKLYTVHYMDCVGVLDVRWREENVRTQKPGAYISLTSNDTHYLIDTDTS